MDPHTATNGAPGNLESHMRSLLLRSSEVDHGQTNGQLTQPSNMSSQKRPVANPASHATTPRRRPNQAQRRQMSFDFSTSTGDPSPTVQSARSYMSPPRFPLSQQGPSGNMASWTVQPSHQGHNPHNYRGANWGHTSPTRNNLSFSYRGPVLLPAGDGGSRQHGMPNRDPRIAQSQTPRHFDMDTPRHLGTAGRLYQPVQQRTPPEEAKAQSEALNCLCEKIDDGIELPDIMEKEAFRCKIEEACRAAIKQHEKVQHGLPSFPAETVQLKCFGSLASGFATKSADMDLGLLSPLSPVQPDAPGSPIPRLLEKTLLDMGLGARLLTRTRVPIIKLCEKPPRQLKLDLLEERARWEAGLGDDVEDDEAGAEDPDRPEEGQQLALDSENASSSFVQSSCKLDDLRQGRKSLGQYYELAKRALREAGGRDVFEKHHGTFTDEDVRLLNTACVAFVDGLTDDTLRDRLLRYRSLNRHDLLSSSRIGRSLCGVYLQATTESLILSWESREPAGDTALELDVDACIKRWKVLQDTTSSETPMLYNQQLNFHSIQLKGQLGVRFMTLSQGRYESASAYSSRVLTLAEEMGKLQYQFQDQAVVKLLHSWYVSGARHEHIRGQMRAFLSSFQTVPFASLVRHHKSLQLAHEYQQGIDSGAYEEDAIPLIENYIRILQSPLREPWERVTLDPDTQKTLSPIWSLGDPWLLSVNQPRNRRDRLEFPKSGLGVQCDINFSPHLALQNSLLLRCYSSTDPRVRPMVLFVKHWAKARDINTPYRGTLSSYGYVLMVLHYLVNIAEPFVCPNLQELAPDRRQPFDPMRDSETTSCQGRDVRFWRNEEEISQLAARKALNNNHESVGSLLRGFFEYYSQTNFLKTKNIRGFEWTQDVLSLRTHGGLLSKRDKGWTGAKTVVEYKAAAAPPSTAPQGQVATEPTSPEGKTSANTVQEYREIKNRYLFAIEDPFEIDHNVARTVSHTGIVAIRDEFRRAWRIIVGVGSGNQGSLKSLVEPVVDKSKSVEQDCFRRLLGDIHGELPALRRK